MYDDVPSVLEDGVRIAAYPDGSVDTFQELRDADGEPLEREALGERIAETTSETFEVVDRTVEPGGQAVNAARQAHALGDDVRLDGCLDDEVLSFPFETRSHGEPSRIDVHDLADGEVAYASLSDDVAGWTHRTFESVPSADAHVCGNWVSVEGMTGSLAALSDRLDGDGEGTGGSRPPGERRSPRVFVFDPGDWTAAGADALRRCADALSELDDVVDVYVSVNGHELDALADALGVEGRPEPVRSAIDLAGIVRHEAAAATGATRDARLEVPNPDVPEPVRRTGAGDRFDAGLAHGLASGSDLGAALALGNCCASHYVATGSTGTATEIADLARAES